MSMSHACFKEKQVTFGSFMIVWQTTLKKREDLNTAKKWKIKI